MAGDSDVDVTSAMVCATALGAVEIGAGARIVAGGVRAAARVVGADDGPPLPHAPTKAAAKTALTIATMGRLMGPCLLDMTSSFFSARRAANRVLKNL